MKLRDLYTEAVWIDESILDEEYPSNWDVEEFAKLTSFSARVKYCEKNLKRISSGSGRIAYLIDSEKVLKLSKNKKGVAQTSTEIEINNDYYLRGLGIFANTFEYNDKGLWVEMEVARKATNSIFKRLIGIEIDKFYYILVVQVTGRGTIWGREPTDEERDNITENGWELLNGITDYLLSYEPSGTPLGDYSRLSTYGVVNRDGEEVIVLIDFGLNNGVYDSYYR